MNLIKSINLSRIGFLLFFLSQLSFAKENIVAKLRWKNEGFALEMRTYAVKQDFRAFISKTGNVKNKGELPVLEDLNNKVDLVKNSSKTVVLVIENKTDSDQYFFAVPHEHNPPQSSAGHFFECLCNGKIYRVRAGGFWYRIVRINLNKYFNSVSEFEIEHKLVKVSPDDVKTKFKDRMYVED